MTPLHLAAGYGKADAVGALIIAGAKVDAEDEDGWTPRGWAVSRWRFRVAHLLRRYEPRKPSKSLRR